MASAASSTTTTPSKSRLSSSTKRQYTELKQAYKAASGAFLVRDYVLAAQHLSRAKAFLPATATTKPIGLDSSWVTNLEQGKDIVEYDLQRKLVILETTYLATVLSSTSNRPNPANVPSDVAKWLRMSPSTLLPSLWLSWLEPQAQSSDGAQVNDILPSASAAYLHPSLVVALTLGALKLGETKAARAILDSWFATVAEDLDKLAWQQSSSVDWSTEFVVDQDTQAMTMSSSVMIGSAAAQGTSTPVSKDRSASAKQALLASWIKAMDLQALHVLPKLGEWEAAEDFVRLQSVENGGWVPENRINVGSDALLAHIRQLQEQDAQLASSRIERSKQLEANRLAASMSASSSTISEKDKRGKSSKGKAKAGSLTSQTRSSSANKSNPSRSSSSSSEVSSPQSSPTKRSSSKARDSTMTTDTSRRSDSPSQLTGFAAMRESLLNYLNSSSSTRRATSSSSSSLLARLPLRSLIQDDPFRLLSLVCLLFAFTSWIRRRRKMGQRTLPSVMNAASGIRHSLVLVGSKMVEFVRMGTKVTQL
ncbi:hypothetical protein OIO90_003387 [Microbotryomycetes sp. JL221]|nr:hypothetical protein OIO90_003387 [Microbotryomycetes sp. JL221]